MEVAINAQHRNKYTVDARLAFPERIVGALRLLPADRIAYANTARVDSHRDRAILTYRANILQGGESRVARDRGY